MSGLLTSQVGSFAQPGPAHPRRRGWPKDSLSLLARQLHKSLKQVGRYAEQGFIPGAYRTPAANGAPRSLGPS